MTKPLRNTSVVCTEIRKNTDINTEYGNNCLLNWTFRVCSVSMYLTYKLAKYRNRRNKFAKTLASTEEGSSAPTFVIDCLPCFKTSQLLSLLVGNNLGECSCSHCVPVHAASPGTRTVELFRARHRLIQTPFNIKSRYAKNKNCRQNHEPFPNCRSTSKAWIMYQCPPGKPLK